MNFLWFLSVVLSPLLKTVFITESATSLLWLNCQRQPSPRLVLRMVRAFDPGKAAGGVVV